MLTVVLTGYFAGLVFWPFALQNVFVNPFESLRVMEHYKVSIRQVFEGEWLWSTQLPWYYLPKWLLIATPGFLLTGFAVFSGLFFYQLKTNRKQLFTELFLFFTLLFPVVYVIVIGANLYSGYRQMLFVIPVLAILAALGFYKLFTLLKNRFWVAGIQVALLIMVLIPVKHQVQTFPVDYVYFNQLSVGNQNAWSEYEYDYYFHGVKEAAEDLIAQTGGNNLIVASNCNLSNYFEELPNTSFRFVRFLERSSEDWDYGIFGVNYIHPRLLKSGKWKSTQIVKTYSHYGNPIVVLMKRTDKSDFEGTKLTDSGNYPEATELLEKALKADENNVWLISYLAKISLKQNDFESFNRYLQQGRMVYPEYEPFFLLEAQQLFNSGKFNEAESVLDKVLTINPHYNVAASLLNEVKKNLNDNKLQ
jgi:tetratricopeptide (TPR) repeat protein